MATRFAGTQHSPGLFDVAQDISGGLPLELIEQWLVSDQSHEDALELLGPHRVIGFNVVSDSAGLTVRGRDLAQGRGFARGAGGSVRASADAAGAAPSARKPDPAKVPRIRP